MAEPLEKLKCLNLYRCDLRGNQLSNFASHSLPCLNFLQLSKLTCVINNDLLTLLIAVAPTLATLKIIDCEIQRRNLDEEHATDAAMSRMVKLQFVTLVGDCGTALSIARAHPPPRITSPLLQDSSRAICRMPAIDCQSLREALKVTGWASVRVTSDVWEVPDSVRQVLQSIALERDIALTIDYD